MNSFISGIRVARNENKKVERPYNVQRIGHPQEHLFVSPVNTNSLMTPSEREHRPGSFVRVDFFSRATTTAAAAAAAALSAFTPFARLLGLFGVRHLSVVPCSMVRAREIERQKKKGCVGSIYLVPI